MGRFENFVRAHNPNADLAQTKPDPRLKRALEHFQNLNEGGDAEAMQEVAKMLREASETLSSNDVQGRASAESLAKKRDAIAQLGEKLSEVFTNIENKVPLSTLAALKAAQSRVESVREITDLQIAKMSGTAPKPTDATPAKKETLAKTKPEAAPSEANSIVGTLLKNIVDDPEEAELLMKSAKERVGKINRKNPEVRAEIKRVAEALQDIQRSLTDKSIPPEDISAWAEQALSHWNVGAENPSQLVDEKNPFIKMMKIDAPTIQEVVQGLLKDYAELDKKRPKQIAPYGSIVSQTAHYGAIAGVLGLTTITYLLAKESLNNLLLKGIQAGRQNETVVNVASAPFRAVGYEPTLQTAMNFAAYAPPALLAVLMLTFIPNRANYAKGTLEKVYKMLGGKLGYSLAFVALAGGSSSYLFEVIGNVDDAKAFAKKVSDKVEGVKTQLEKIPALVETARRGAIKGVLERAQAEAQSGFGRKTMTILYSGGLLHPSFQTFVTENAEFVKTLSPEMQAFLKQDYQAQFDTFAVKNPKHRTEWEAFLLARAKEVNPRATEFRDALAIPQAIQRFAEAVQPLRDEKGARSRAESLAKLQSGSKALEGTDALKAFLRSLHIGELLPQHLAESVNLQDLPNSIEIEAMRDALTAGYGPYISRYENLRDKDVKAIAARIRAVGVAAGLTSASDKTAFDAMATVFESLDKLPITAEGFRKEMATLVAPKIRTAVEVLLSEDGWKAITESVNRTGFDKFIAGLGLPLNLMGNEQVTVMGEQMSRATLARAFIVFTVLRLYGLVSEWALPDYGFIKVNDSMRERRLMARSHWFGGKGEIRERNEEIDDLLMGLASKTVDRIDAFYRKAGSMTGQRGEYGAVIGRDLRVAHVRGRLAEMMANDLDEPGSASLLAEQARFITSGEVPSVSQAINRMAATALAPINAVLEQFLSFKQTADPRRSRKNEQIAWVGTKMRELKDGDMAEIFKLTGTLYPNFVTAAGALGQATFTEGAEKISAIDNMREAVQAMSLQELETAIPEVALQIAVLQRGAHELTSKSTVDVSDPKPIIPGQRLVLTEEYLDQAFVLGSIHDDLKRYRVMLKEMRAEGRRIAAEHDASAPNADPSAIRVPPIFEDRDDNAWIEADLNSDQLRTLRHLMRERIGFLEKKGEKRKRAGSFSLEEINTTVNDIARGARPALDIFKATVNASDRLRLVGKNYFFAYGYSPLVEGPTLLLYAADPPGMPGGGESIGIPFPGRIPDPTGKTTDETIAEISLWLSNGGDAMNTLDAQLMAPSIREVQKYAEQRILESFNLEDATSVRIALTPEILTRLVASKGSDKDKRFTSNDLINLARINRVNTWMGEHRSILEGAYLGLPITPQQIGQLYLQNIELPETNEVSDKDYFSVVEDVKLIAHALTVVRDRIPAKTKKALNIAYDPKPIDGPEIVFTRKKKPKTETRIKITASDADIVKEAERMLASSK